MSSLVGKKAPSFRATAIVNGSQTVADFSLEQYVGKKYVVLFFYPADFSPVCPVELHSFQKKLAEFEKRDTVVVGCSVDSQFSHLKWLSIDKNEGGIKGVTYPIVSDQTKLIAKEYGVLAGEYSCDGEKPSFTGAPMAYRGLFLIDKAGVVQHQIVNHFLITRSVNEVLRVVDALQFTEKNGAACPIEEK